MGEEMKGKVSLDVSAFESAARKAQDTAKNFGLSVERSLGVGAFKGMVAGALTVGAVTHEIMGLIHKADEIDKVSKRFDITAESVQAIQFAAEQSGSSAETMFKAMKKLAMAQEKAKGGNDEYVASLQSLGVSVQEISTLTPEQLFYRIGDAMAKAEAGSVKFADANKVLGKSSDSVLAAMRDGFTDVAKKAKETGLVIRDELVAQLAEAKDKLEEFEQRKTVAKANALGLAGYELTRGSAATAAAVQVRTQRSKLAQAFASFLNVGDLAAYLGGLTVDPAKLFFEKKKYKKKTGVDDKTAPEPPKLERVTIPGLNLTANQQIGAYSGQNPLLNRQLAIDQAMLDLQRKVADEAKKTAQNTEKLITALQVNDFN
jgi:hypothetical protein